MLKVNDINVYYGAIHAIKGVSFQVSEGEVVTLIGANGAGKSTILNTVCGLLRSRTGSVEFLGKNLASLPAHKIVELGMAHVPEGRRIFQQMTVEENLEMGAYTQARSTIEPGLERVYGQFPRLKERRKARKMRKMQKRRRKRKERRKKERRRAERLRKKRSLHRRSRKKKTNRKGSLLRNRKDWRTAMPMRTNRLFWKRRLISNFSPVSEG